MRLEDKYSGRMPISKRDDEPRESLKVDIRLAHDRIEKMGARTAEAYDRYYRGDPGNLRQEFPHAVHEFRLVESAWLSNKPITVVVIKDFGRILEGWRDLGGWPKRAAGEESESLMFKVIRGSMRGGDEEEKLLDAYEGFPAIGQFIVERSGENRWMLSDRYILPRFRGQHIGSLLMHAVETFLSERADRVNAKQDLVVNTGQPSVIGFALENKEENGFRPDTPGDARRLDMILRGDQRLLLDHAKQRVVDGLGEIIHGKWQTLVEKDPYVFEGAARGRTERDAFRVQLVKCYGQAPENELENRRKKIGGQIDAAQNE